MVCVCTNQSIISSALEKIGGLLYSIAHRTVLVLSRPGILQNKSPVNCTKIFAILVVIFGYKSSNIFLMSQQTTRLTKSSAHKFKLLLFMDFLTEGL